MAALVASVAEEAGFRGYFQSVLEHRVGGPLAILIMAFVIAPAHGLTQGFAWPTLLFYFLVDAMFGWIAYLTDSILPGLTIHFVGLLIFFSLIWPYDPTRRLITTGGADLWFWLHTAQTFIFAVLSIAAFRHLVKIARRN
jgi:Type II CAAX prenyl endopeptidase Rce1-like